MKKLGPPRKGESLALVPKRRKRLIVKLNEEERLLLELIANEEDITLSEAVRRSVVRAYWVFMVHGEEVTKLLKEKPDGD